MFDKKLWKVVEHFKSIFRELNLLARGKCLNSGEGVWRKLKTTVIRESVERKKLFPKCNCAGWYQNKLVSLKAAEKIAQLQRFPLKTFPKITKNFECSFSCRSERTCKQKQLWWIKAIKRLSVWSFGYKNRLISWLENMTLCAYNLAWETKHIFLLSVCS